MFTVQSLVEGGSYRGAQGFREWLLSWSEMFGEEWECRVEEAEEIEDEGVLVTGRISVRGVGGGVPVDQRFWMIQRFGAGKVSRSQIYTDREQAAQAAGLGT